jgi:hypothetical protein
LFFLLYKSEARDTQALRSGGEYVFDLALRILDLRSGRAVEHIEIAEGPLHKWPSVAEADDRGVVILYRDARANTSKVVYLGNG